MTHTEIVVEGTLKPDGTLAAPPMVLTSGHTPLFIASYNSVTLFSNAEKDVSGGGEGSVQLTICARWRAVTMPRSQTKISRRVSSETNSTIAVSAARLPCALPGIDLPITSSNSRARARSAY